MDPNKFVLSMTICSVWQHLWANSNNAVYYKTFENFYFTMAAATQIHIWSKPRKTKI